MKKLCVIFLIALALLAQETRREITNAAAKPEDDAKGLSAQIPDVYAVPNGQVSLDANRNSVQPAYVVQIVKDGGELGFKVVKTIDQVDQTFGGLFNANSPDPSRDEPAKATGNPPPWSNG